MYSFTPTSREGAKEPKLKNQLCYGWNLSDTNDKILKEINSQLQLKWLLQAYKLFPNKDAFFSNSFNRLAGNAELMQQIKDGKSESEIKRSWQPKLNEFKKIRKKYLLYKE